MKKPPFQAAWLGDAGELNPDLRVHNPQCCRYTSISMGLRAILRSRDTFDYDVAPGRTLLGDDAC